MLRRGRAAIRRAHGLLLGHRAYVAAGRNGLRIFTLQEPAFTSVQTGEGGLNLVWNDIARGMVLQQASQSMTDWRDVPGSAETNRFRVAIEGGGAYFRLREP